MKIAGAQLALPRATLTLSRPDGCIVLEFQALPVGFLDRCEALCPYPIPKVVGVVRENGKPLKDESGNFVPLYNERSPEYRAKRRVVNRRHFVMALVEATRESKSITFTAPEPARDAPGEAWEAWCDACLAELQTSGLSDGEENGLIDFIFALSHIGEKDLEEVRRRFLPAASTVNVTGASASGNDSESPPSSS